MFLFFQTVPSLLCSFIWICTTHVAIVRILFVVVKEKLFLSFHFRVCIFFMHTHTYTCEYTVRMTYNGIRVRVTKNRGERVREIRERKREKKVPRPFCRPPFPLPSPPLQESLPEAN